MAKSAAWYRRRERYSRLARLVGAAIGGRVERRIERHLLERAWVDTKRKRLRRYLVGSYQNPVINVQSILVRHELIREVDGGSHDELMDEELRWAVDKQRALRKRQSELLAEHGKTWAEIRGSGMWQVAFDEVLTDPDRFAVAWTEALRADRPSRLSVIEAACGSANDYRYFDSYGMARMLKYTGFDLTRKNIANAHQMFPDVDFRVGDAQEIDAADGTYECAMAHDFLEHLSPSAFNRAIDELCRVSRRMVLISFFNMRDQPEHQIQPTRTYHFNVLSKDRIAERVARHCSDLWVHVRPMLAERYG